MRKITLFAAASLFATPMVALAMPSNDSLLDRGVVAADDGAAGKVSYKDGTRIEAGDFDMKLNLLIQPRGTFEDSDQDARGGEDSTSFDVNKARLLLTGNGWGKDVSFRLYNDFVDGSQSDGSKGSSLQDAWLQFNLDPQAMVRFGQDKTSYSRQFNVDDHGFQFIDQSEITDSFAIGRATGVMVHGQLDDQDSMHYSAGVNNGESDGEGQNRSGVDPDIQGVAQVYMNIGDYGSRRVEGDLRSTEEFAATVGAAVAYGQGSTSDEVISSDFDKVDVNVDGGIRSAGLSVQSEFYYSMLDLDAAEDSSDDFGFYAQAGYMFVPKEWEVAFRFGLAEPDDESILFPGIDDAQEYAFVLNYFMAGHNLKIQTGISWVVENYDSGDDATDTRYQVQATGLL